MAAMSTGAPPVFGCLPPVVSTAACLYVAAFVHSENSFNGCEVGIRFWLMSPLLLSGQLGAVRWSNKATGWNFLWLNDPS